MRAVGDSMIISPQLIMNHEEIDTMIERATKALDQTAQHYSV
jgi:putrescine aminotransferase